MSNSIGQNGANPVIEPEVTPADSQLEVHDEEKLPPMNEHIVHFDGPDDPYNAINWPFKKKITVTLLYAFITLGATWGSTAYNSGIGQVRQQFHVNSEAALSGMS